MARLTEAECRRICWALGLPPDIEEFVLIKHRVASMDAAPNAKPDVAWRIVQRAAEEPFPATGGERE